MRKLSILLVLAAAVAAGSCQQAAKTADPWFDGDFDAALSEAGSRGTLVLLEFFSDT